MEKACNLKKFVCRYFKSRFSSLPLRLGRAPGFQTFGSLHPHELTLTHRLTLRKSAHVTPSQTLPSGEGFLSLRSEVLRFKLLHNAGRQPRAPKRVFGVTRAGFRAFGHHNGKFVSAAASKDKAGQRITRITPKTCWSLPLELLET